MNLLNLSFLKQNNENNNSVPYQTKLSLLLISIYILFQLPLYLSPVKVPDEQVFFNLAMEKIQSGGYDKNFFYVITHQHNEFGYGAIYWIIYCYFLKLCSFLLISPEASFIFTRLLSLLYISAIPLIILSVGVLKKSNFTLFTVLFWISLPSAWWYGKITGPELPSLFVGLLGVYLATLLNHTGANQKKKLLCTVLGYILIGVSIGIKLTNIPLLVFSALTFLFYEYKKIKWYFTIFFSSTLGFIISNLFILQDFNLYVTTLNKYKTSSNFSLTYLERIFSGVKWEWDIVSSSGLTHWTFNIYLLIIFVILLFILKVPKTKLLILGITFIITNIMFLSNGSFLGWYWLPFIVLLPFIFLNAQNNKRKIKIISYLFILLIITFNFNSIQHAYSLKISHISNMRDAEKMVKTLEDTITQYGSPIDTLVNMGEIGLSIQLPNKQPVGFVPSFLWEYDQYKVSGKTVLFVLGDRVLQNDDYQKIKQQLDSGTMNKNGLIYDVKKTERAHFTTLYFLEQRSS